MSVRKRSTLRDYFLITLSHAEKRKVTQEQIAKRLKFAFNCVNIVVSREKHEGEVSGFHYHIAVHAQDASKNTATKLIRQSFPEFEGAQCNVKFHKSWAVMLGYITKQDKSPFIEGNSTLEEILEIGKQARSKRRYKDKTATADTLMDSLKEYDDWIQVYKSKELRERLIYGSHSNLRSIFEDLNLIKSTEKSPLERIEEYIREKEKELNAPIEEYEAEELTEKYILLDWIACNIAFTRPIKTKQLHLYGPPSTQKTFIFDCLKKVLRIYFASSRINDFAGADDYYDLWVYDEFHQLDPSEGN